MAEHGFYQFYHSLLDFQRNNNSYFIRSIIRNDDDLQLITIKQMRKPIIIFLYLNGIATIIFVAEILIYKWLKWRNCKQSTHFYLKLKPNEIYFSKRYVFSIRPNTDFTTCGKATQIKIATNTNDNWTVSEAMSYCTTKKEKNKTQKY